MRARNYVSLAISGFGIGLTSLGAFAAPLVIPGIGPAEAQRIFGESLQRRAVPASRPQAAPVAAYAAPAAQMVRTAATPNYGGGFLELLITGQDPTPRGQVLYNRPQAIRQAPQAQPAYRGEPLQASYAPEPAYRVNRGFDPRYARQDIAYGGPHAPGTIVVDTPNKYLYLVTGPGRAVRYGIGVGRPGFEWSGVKTITRKAEWPDWTPPPEMLKRRPDLPRFMPGGPDNPLGARALYLGSSLYRIHGTNEPHTIGQNVSSGCIRMMNEDVEDLYGRVRVGSKVIVI